ncbi:MAG TPA: hypothetical protein VFQ24_02215 [Terriglobia bacterium]|nr:hypothetical protein [Terriglobia bacterium]
MTVTRAADRGSSLEKKQKHHAKAQRREVGEKPPCETEVISEASMWHAVEVLDLKYYFNH